jgi:periplasmic copper chaperone A
MNPIRRSLLAAALLAASTAQAQNAVKVDKVWARPTVAGQSGGGGFLTITGGAAADKLISASAGVSKAVELHKMEMDGNVMRMRPIDGGIDVPAGATVMLQPGGLHIMFIGLNKTLKAGDSFPMTLKFEKAGDVKVDVKVMTQRADAGEHKP